MSGFSPSTISLLKSVSDLSGGKLIHREDLGTLIDIASRRKRGATLDELSFLAKFVSRVHGIMQRIGKNGEGYERLAAEFGSNTQNAVALVKSLLEGEPQDVQENFSTTYLAMTPASLQNLIGLFHDLSWYKNWLIDHPKEQW